MPDQQTALEQHNQKEVETATENFTKLKSAEDFLQFARNISEKGEHLKQLTIKVLDNDRIEFLLGC